VGSGLGCGVGARGTAHFSSPLRRQGPSALHRTCCLPCRPCCSCRSSCSCRSAPCARCPQDQQEHQDQQCQATIACAHQHDARWVGGEGVTMASLVRKTYGPFAMRTVYGRSVTSRVDQVQEPVAGIVGCINSAVGISKARPSRGNAQPGCAVRVPACLKPIALDA
jgi:hypothetical protein